MLNNNKCILAYGLNSEELQGLEKIGVKIVEVTAEMTQMSLDEILQGLKFKTFDPNPIDAKVIILNNFSDNEIRTKVSLIRSTVNDCILAMPTANNRAWKFNYLTDHLVKEREWHRNNQKGR